MKVFRLYIPTVKIFPLAVHGTILKEYLLRFCNEKYNGDCMVGNLCQNFPHTAALPIML